jgi:homoserine dehydrogenase
MHVLTSGLTPAGTVAGSGTVLKDGGANARISAPPGSNKIANTLEFAYYEKLRNLGGRRGSRYLYETTVGAATPMLQVLRDLRRTGDAIHRVESLVPGELKGIADPHEFLNRLADIDASWSARALRSAGRRTLLAYIARYDGTTASVGVEEVGRESPFVRLRASENAVHYYSDRHRPIPLTIQGIGAGPEVTARGVFVDLIHTAVDLAA